MAKTSMINREAKRQKLAKNHVFLTKWCFLEPETQEWDEHRIDERTAAMIEAILETRPVPAPPIRLPQQPCKSRMRFGLPMSRSPTAPVTTGSGG